jgi:hypothetical protein
MTSAANATLNLPVRTLIAVCLSGWSLSWLVGSERLGQGEIPQVSEASFFAATGVWVVGDEGLPLLWQREGFVSQLGVSVAVVQPRFLQTAEVVGRTQPHPRAPTPVGCRNSFMQLVDGIRGGVR